MGRIGKKQNGSRSKTVTKLHLVWVPLEIKEKKTISRSLLLVDRENSVGFSAMSLAMGNLAPKLKKLKIKLHKEVEYTYEVGEDKNHVVRGIETENRKWRFQIFAAKKAIGVCPSWTDLNSDASALTKIFANVKKFHKNVDSSSYISDGVYALERKIQGTTHYEFIGIEKLNIEDADTETKGKKNEKEKKTEKSKKDDKDKKDVKEKDCDIPWNEDRKKLAEKLDDLVSKKKKELNIEIDGKSSDGSDSGSDSDSDSDSDSESSSSSSSSSASSSSSSSSCEKKKKKKKKNAAKKKGAKKVKKSNKKKK